MTTQTISRSEQLALLPVSFGSAPRHTPADAEIADNLQSVEDSAKSCLDDVPNIEARVKQLRECRRAVDEAERNVTDASKDVDRVIESGGSAEAERGAMAKLREAQDALELAQRRAQLNAPEGELAKAVSDLRAAREAGQRVEQKLIEARDLVVWDQLYWDIAAALVAATLRAAEYHPHRTDGPLGSPYDTLADLVRHDYRRDRVFRRVGVLHQPD